MCHGGSGPRGRCRIYRCFPFRGKGIGGRLIVEMANSLAAEGLRPVFLCAPERVRFYTRLGFAKQAEYARYVPEK